MDSLYPIRLEASLHETIWGGQRLGREGWKQAPSTSAAIGEAWETEISTVVQNGPQAGKTLATLVAEWEVALFGEQSMSIFGRRFPLLAKFIDANAKLSVQVHPHDGYAAQRENGKLGKTEFWYILAADPGATIVHGFKATTSREEVQQAIQNVTLETLLHEEHVQAGDVLFVPAGTVHAIGSGVLLYELQEYSDLTYRMYDYGRLTSTGLPRELHIERSLDVTHYDISPTIKVNPVSLNGGPGYDDRCLVACPYFVTRELSFKQNGTSYGYMKSKTHGSCIILTSLDASVQVRYGTAFEHREPLSRGQTMVLPAALGQYCIEGTGKLMLSYVPDAHDTAWQRWEVSNGSYARE